ncbi:hypothetical protein ACGFZA_15905 [Streptomyces sp. NPDC048211]|uniref:hypothetical protein n=1 Tax=Streptomyces sp. NPDC048211 TaxID=3365516 RepID=UPI00371403C4
MYEPVYARVAASGQTRDHIVRLGQFFDGEGKALCGVKPFPDKWVEVNDDTAGVNPCPGCIQELGGRRAVR